MTHESIESLNATARRIVDLAGRWLAAGAVMQAFPPEPYLDDPKKFSRPDLQPKLNESSWEVYFLNGERLAVSFADLLRLITAMEQMAAQAPHGKRLNVSIDDREVFTPKNIERTFEILRTGGRLQGTPILQPRTAPAPMDFKEFSCIAVSHWNAWLSFLANYPPASTSRRLYPSLILLTESPSHYVFEIMGADERFDSFAEGKSAIKHAAQSVRHYLEQFPTAEGDVAFKLSGRNTWWSGLLFMREEDMPLLEARYRFRRDGRPIIALATTMDYYFDIDPKSSVYFQDCILVNRRESMVRMKPIIAMGIVPKSFTSLQLLGDLADKTRCTNPLHDANARPWGTLRIVDNISKGHSLYEQFANLFLTPDLRETKIGTFLAQHPEIIQRALRYEASLSERRFDWQEGNPDPTEKSIRPDLMLHRGSDFYDICDLKTCCLDRPNITKGGHRRRRFIDYVGEGIAQLVNYREYFTFKLNQDHAWSAHRVKVQNPKLYLVVGSYENFDKDEVAEAKRSLDKDIVLIDYDTLNTLYLDSVSANRSR